MACRDPVPPIRGCTTLDRDLKELRLPYEEWEALFRKVLLMERVLWRQMEPEPRAPALTR